MNIHLIVGTGEEYENRQCYKVQVLKRVTALRAILEARKKQSNFEKHKITDQVTEIKLLWRMYDKSSHELS